MFGSPCPSKAIYSSKASFILCHDQCRSTIFWVFCLFSFLYLALTIILKILLFLFTSLRLIGTRHHLSPPMPLEHAVVRSFIYLISLLLLICLLHLLNFYKFSL